jgi:hypothetical protein
MIDIQVSQKYDIEGKKKGEIGRVGCSSSFYYAPGKQQRETSLDDYDRKRKVTLD